MVVRASRWITKHEYIVNVNAALSYLNNIIRCGIRGKAVTSLNLNL